MKFMSFTQMFRKERIGFSTVLTGKIQMETGTQLNGLTLLRSQPYSLKSPDYVVAATSNPTPDTKTLGFLWTPLSNESRPYLNITNESKMMYNYRQSCKTRILV
ncbi:hypothetical protein ACTXT7_001647 [Hymenolepis weldensis]